MSSLNLGILAHVDAGKTTLSERLLYETRVITSIGRVDHGNTITDSDALERQRGITIRSAVVAFRIGALKVNLIDTPGHSDFVAEVERALAVLDGAVLVVSAVEGVQAQTRVLIRIMERLEIPFLIFVNKIDRVGASYDDTLAALRDAVSGDVVVMTVPCDTGDRDAYIERTPTRHLLRAITEQVADYDDAVLSKYIDHDALLNEAQATRGLRDLTTRGIQHPVYFGAALHGVGVPELMEAIATFLPPAPDASDLPLHAQVFKIEGARGSRPKVAYVRLRTGTLASRDHVTRARRSATGQVVERQGRASAVRVMDHGTATIEVLARSGDIAAVVGLSDAQIGDQLGHWEPGRGGQLFAEPGLEAVVRAERPDERPALFAALRRLSEQDPLIAARLDGVDDDITVSLYGEVQKEVIAARLLSEFGITARFESTRTVHVERVAGTGEAVATVPTQNATVGLRIEPGEIDSGLTYRLATERGWLLPSYHTAIEETLAMELQHGLHGWQVRDCVVTLTASRFSAPTPPAGYFRQLTSLTLRAALRTAGTTVCEPISHVEVEFPAGLVSQLMRELAAAGAVPIGSALGPGRGRISGTMPTAAVHGLESRLPHLTQGLGVLLVRPAGFRALTSDIPVP